MLCDSFTKLSALQRVQMVGEIVHAFQSDNATFKNVQDLIQLAKLKGIFDSVTINPYVKESQQDFGHDQNHLQELT